MAWEFLCKTPRMLPSPKKPPEHISHLGSSRRGVTCLSPGRKSSASPIFRMSVWGPSEPLLGIGLPLFQPPSCTSDWPNRFWERGAGSRHVETAACPPARFPPPLPPLLPAPHNTRELALPGSGAMLTSPPEDPAASPELPGCPGALDRAGGWTELPG